jgi:hypothetical protein
MAVQVCLCCCANFSERDLCCIGTRYSQIVIEFAGFGESELCACPNELGALTIDFNQQEAEFSICSLDAFGSEGGYIVRVFPVAGCSYDEEFLVHDWSPGINAVLVQLQLFYISFGQTVFAPMYFVTAITQPTSNTCEACDAFLDRIQNQTYTAIAERTLNGIGFGCNQVLLTWYLQ